MAIAINLDEAALLRTLRNEEFKAYGLEVANQIVDEAQSTAPKTRRPSYAPSIRPDWGLGRTLEGPDVYIFYVIASRHEMVIEYGWHDLIGRWHPGKFNLTKALKKIGRENR